MGIVGCISASDCDASSCHGLTTSRSLVVKSCRARHGEQVSGHAIICIRHRCRKGSVVDLVACSNRDYKWASGDICSSGCRGVLGVVGCVSARDCDTSGGHSFVCSRTSIAEGGTARDGKSIASDSVIGVDHTGGS